MDKTFEFDGLNVFIDATSLMYLQGASVDYFETLEGACFKFENPNVKSTWGCGSSFQRVSQLCRKRSEPRSLRRGLVFLVSRVY